MLRRDDPTASSQRTICATLVQGALAPLEGRWKMMILAHLSASPTMRFSDLQRAIPAVSQKVLIQQLRALETDGIIVRRLHPQVPPRVDYGLTPLGKALNPVFQALLDWAEERRKTAGDALQLVDPPRQTYPPAT